MCIRRGRWGVGGSLARYQKAHSVKVHVQQQRQGGGAGYIQMLRLPALLHSSVAVFVCP